jgi:hypothetical protein
MFAVWAFMWQLYGVWQYFAGNVAHIIRGGACGALRRKKTQSSTFQSSFMIFP